MAKDTKAPRSRSSSTQSEASKPKELRCHISAAAHSRGKAIIDRYGSDWKTFLSAVLESFSENELDERFVKARRAS